MLVIIVQQKVFLSTDSTLTNFRTVECFWGWCCSPVFTVEVFVGFMFTSVHRGGGCWVHVHQCSPWRCLWGSCSPVFTVEVFVGFMFTSVHRGGVCGFMFTSVHRGGVCGVHVHQCSPWRCLWGSCSPVFTMEVFVGFMFTSVHRGGVCGVHVHQCSPWRCLWGSCSPVFTVEVFVGFMFTSVHRGGVCGVHVHQCSPWGVDGVHVVHQCSPWRCLWGSCSPVFTVEVFVGFMFTSVHRGGVCGVHVHQCSPWRCLWCSCSPVFAVGC